MSTKKLKRKSVIILIDDDRKIECWGSLKKACDAHPELVYNTITKFKMPVYSKGWAINRVKFNEK